MDIVDFVIAIALNYVIFKLGEHYAYFKIARGLQNLKDHAEEIGSTQTVGTMQIEKIGDQYYAYINDNFVGQGPSIDEVKKIAQQTIEKDPTRYVSIKD